MQNNSAFEGNYMHNFQDAQKGKHFPGAVISWNRDGNHLYFHGEETILQVSVVTDTIIRFRYANYGMFEDDFSYAINPGFAPAIPKLEVLEDSSHYAIHTAKLVVTINKVTMGTNIRNHQNFVVMEDELGFHWEDHNARGGNIVIAHSSKKEGTALEIQLPVKKTEEKLIQTIA